MTKPKLLFSCGCQDILQQIWLEYYLLINVIRCHKLKYTLLSDFSIGKISEPLHAIVFRPCKQVTMTE